MAAKTKTAAKPKNKGGRPTKFYELSPRIPLLARSGFTDVQISETLGITEVTLFNWKKKHPEFFKSLNDWKYEADKDVVRSLYERAKGYNHPETKAQWVTDDIVVNGEWKKVGRWEYADMIRHYPPDPTSMIFWLKNRDKENWRDKQEVEHSGEVSNKLLSELFTGVPQLIQLLQDRLTAPNVGQLPPPASTTEKGAVTT